MADHAVEQSATFSLVRGGPFYNFERRLRLEREGIQGIAVRAAAAVAITFLPLVVLSAMHGDLAGARVTIPLLLDWTVYARFVIAIPLLLNAERIIDARLSLTVAHARTSGLVEGQARAGLESAIAKLERARDLVLPEAVLIAIAFVLACFNSRAVLGLNVSSWRAITPGLESSTTWAGLWFDLVSLPLFHFLYFRWLWRIGLWALFLARVSRLDLRLVPTHPDGAGGLGFLGMAHSSFGAILIPLAAAVASRGVQWVQFGGGTIGSLRNSLIAFVVVALAIALGPLLVFLPKLVKTKRFGLLEYAKLASDYSSGFDQKWLRGNPRPTVPLLGTADIQSLADLNNSFQIIKNMRVILPDRQTAASLIMAAALPMLPFLTAIMPLEKIFKQLAQLVLR